MSCLPDLLFDGQIPTYDDFLEQRRAADGPEGQDLVPGALMIADLPTYPEHRYSGVEWLGDVPEHWDVLRTRFLLREVDHRSVDGTETHLSMSQKLGLVPSSRVEQRTLVSESYAGGKLCDEDDLVLNRLKAHLGVFALARQSGVISPDYTVLKKARPMAMKYFEHVLKSPACRSELRVRAKGIVEGFWRLYTDDLYDIRLPVPPLLEQAAIVRFLDHADRRIRRYIRAKQTLIKLLEEQKQAIIHRAVTRGLDPNVRLKPSGVEWLGDVPEHWIVAALRHRYSQVLGKMLDAKRITGSHSLPYLRNTDVQWDRIKVDDLPTMDIPAAEYGRYSVQKGDLLVCEGGEVGRCAIWSGELGICGFQKALHRLRPVSAARDVPRFMYYALRAAAKGNAFNDGHVSTIAHLTGDKLRAHGFPFPPVAEQESIVSFLDSALKQVDQAAAVAVHEISFLREYRTRLIADVVTGKLDVREVAARLPDEVDEPEPLDETDPMTDAEEGTADDLDAAPEEAQA